MRQPGESLDWQPDDPVLRAALGAMARTGDPNELAAGAYSDDPERSSTENHHDAHIARLERAVDEQLEAIYTDAQGVIEWDFEMAKTFMRAAFEKGYIERDKDNRTFGVIYMVRRPSKDKN